MKILSYEDLKSLDKCHLMFDDGFYPATQVGDIDDNFCESIVVVRDIKEGIENVHNFSREVNFISFGSLDFFKLDTLHLETWSSISFSELKTFENILKKSSMGRFLYK